MKKRCKGKELFEEFNGTILVYRNLPYRAKRAVNVFYRDELGRKINRRQPFGFVELPLDVLASAVYSSMTAYSYFKDFQEYHKWYISDGNVSDHRSVWPVILDADDDEVIFDGWHRFHGYVEKDIKLVPCILPMFSIKGCSDK